MTESTTLMEDVACAGLASWNALPFLENVTWIGSSIIDVFNQQTQPYEYSTRSLGETVGYSASEINWGPSSCRASVILTICPRMFRIRPISA